MSRVGLLPMVLAVGVGAVTGVAVGGPAQLIGVVLGLPLLYLLASLASIVTALAVGIKIHTLDLGLGRPLRTWERGVFAVTLRAVPLGVGWTGYARGSRGVRSRFAAAQLAAVLGWTAAAVLALVALDLPGLFVTAMLLVLAGLLPSNGWGVPDALRQALTIPRMSEAEVLDWWNTRPGGQARDAALAGRLAAARELAERALQADPADRAAWRALNIVGNDQPDTALALRSAEQLAAQTKGLPYATAQATDQGNLAWALVRTAESGQPVPDWERRARVALYEADAVGEQTWQRLHTRALLSVLAGDAELADELLERPRQEAIVPSQRVSVLLTESLIANRRGDSATAATRHAEAVALWPDSPRIDDVAGQLTAQRAG